MRRCLFCYKILAKDEQDFHPSCSRKMFGFDPPPEIPFTENQMEELAKQVVRSRITIPGAQPKLSLHLVRGNGKTFPWRFTIVGFWGDYILKPPATNYPHLPEIEDLTMDLAAIAGVNVVPHTLIRLQSKSLAYLTKRIDRVKGRKLCMEDMCQLTERLTEDKYNGSYEQIAKAILMYSANPGLDVVNFFEQVLFSFLTGNSDMHLKNFSLIRLPTIGYVLSPAYDMVATALVNRADNEDLALTLNGKKKRINRSDFRAAFNTLKLDEKQQANIFNKMEYVKSKWMQLIGISFIPKEDKASFKDLIKERFARLK